MKQVRKPPRLHGSLLNVLLLLFVAVLLVVGVFLVRVKLLQNAQSLGMALVHSYAVEEELNITSLETNLTMASQFLDDIINDGGDPADIQNWLAGYFSKLTDIIGEGMVDFYAVIDGEIVAVNPWEEDDTYPYESTEWYRMAVAAEGRTVRGDAYVDAITGQMIFTISKRLNEEGNVLAMDVYVQNEAMHNTAQTLPEDCSYFLCDEKGRMLYSSTKWDMDQTTIQSYIDYIMAGIADGTLLAYDAFVEDTEGVSRGVYYQTMSNGWTVIMTIPVLFILMGDENAFIYFLAAVALALFLTLTIVTIVDTLRSRSMKKADDTAHMLGDSFYSIYRVNLWDGSYEGIKVYHDLEDKVPKKGSYSVLLETMRPLVKPSTYRTFEVSFSLESIRQRIDQGIDDYGGDYQRLFGDSYRWVNIRTLYDRERAPNEVILCFRDVDEEKRRELQTTMILQDALDAAQKSTKAKSEFFSGMSHDMRTPLNAVIGCCTMAEKSNAAGDGAKVREYLRKIQFAANQLLELINDILEMSRMEAGKHNLDQREMDLETLLYNIAEIFRDRIQEEEKTLEVSIDFQETVVLGDEKKLTQILNNLLSNAVKYSNPGDTIRLEARQFHFQQHSKYQIVVEDTGIGMSPEFLERLFDPYARETAFSARPTVGTGLGMSIVKSLVQQMSGEISVESRLGEGTRFTVTIPLKTAGHQDQPPAPAREPEDFDWRIRRVLVAEDNEINREIVTELLRQFGADVQTAVNGQEAVRAFMDAPLFSIDAILMDMQMPVMDGCEAAAAIRGLGRADAAGVPIVAVTANVFAEDIARTTRAGMNDHISKPIDGAVLSRTLQKLMTEWDRFRDAAGNTEQAGGQSGV